MSKINHSIKKITVNYDYAKPDVAEIHIFSGVDDVVVSVERIGSCGHWRVTNVKAFWGQWIKNFMLSREGAVLADVLCSVIVPTDNSLLRTAEYTIDPNCDYCEGLRLAIWQ